MARVVQHLVGQARLHHAAALHHHDAVGEQAGHREIVRDQYRGDAQPRHQAADHPAALNGASDLVARTFGEAAGHSRMIFTNPEMPLDAPVLIVMMAEVEG